MVLPRIGSTVEYYSIEDIGAYTKVAIGKIRVGRWNKKFVYT